MQKTWKFPSDRFWHLLQNLSTLRTWKVWRPLANIPEEFCCIVFLLNTTSSFYSGRDLPPFLLSLSAFIHPSALPSICQSIHLSGSICHFSCHLNHPPIRPSIFQALHLIVFQCIPPSLTAPSCLLCAAALLWSERLLRRWVMATAAE